MAAINPLTIGEFEALPDALARNRELIAGELVESPGNTGNHNMLRDGLVELLRPFVQEHKLGLIVSEQEYASAMIASMARTLAFPVRPKPGCSTAGVVFIHSSRI